jgi:hypothetical protein
VDPVLAERLAVVRGQHEDAPVERAGVGQGLPDAAQRVVGPQGGRLVHPLAVGPEDLELRRRRELVNVHEVDVEEHRLALVARLDEVLDLVDDPVRVGPEGGLLVSRDPPGRA